MSDGSKRAIASVLKEEGGYVNNPNDPGGETRFGISKRAHPDVDIYNLSIEEAINIYKKEYWNPSAADKLPSRLQNFYFHMVVMSGQKQAVRTLQRACNGKNHNLKVDGLIGRNTIAACEDLELNRLRAYRMLFYAKLVIKDQKLETFYYGWFRRMLRTK